MEAFNKQGKKISFREFFKLSKNIKYRRIAFSTIKNISISTIWLGINHNFLGSKPLIFETIVFKDYEEQEMRRYATIRQAKAGHNKLIKKYRPNAVK